MRHTGTITALSAAVRSIARPSDCMRALTSGRFIYRLARRIHPD
jgi:hypothetical protein